MISMGACCVVAVHGERAWRIVPPEVEPKSTVGSGDSFVAGLGVALARGDDLPTGFRLGTAAGAATAGSSGTGMGRADAVMELLPRVRLDRL